MDYFAVVGYDFDNEGNHFPVFIKSLLKSYLVSNNIHVLQTKIITYEERYW